MGMLKRLRGTPIVRHDAELAMVYSPHPPYEILQNREIDFATMQRMRRFSRYWDLIANSGNFVETTPLIWQDRSPFELFLSLSDWLFATTRQTHAIALQSLAELIFRFLTEAHRSNRHWPRERSGETISASAGVIDRRFSNRLLRIRRCHRDGRSFNRVENARRDIRRDRPLEAWQSGLPNVWFNC